MMVRDFEVLVKPGVNAAHERGYLTVVQHAGAEVVRSWEADEAAAQDFAEFCRDQLAAGYAPRQCDDDGARVEWHKPRPRPFAPRPRVPAVPLPTDDDDFDPDRACRPGPRARERFRDREVFEASVVDSYISSRRYMRID